MKRLAPLALIVFSLAVVPAALADDGTPPAQPAAAPSTQAAPAASHSGSNLRLRLEIMRLRVMIVHLRFRLQCGPNGKAPQDKCVAFAQKVEDRLTTFDGNVQKKIDELKACTPDSTDQTCKNADKKIDLLTKIDTRVQKAIQNVQDWLNGKTTTSSTSDSSLDQAATDLSQAAAGSNG